MSLFPKNTAFGLDITTNSVKLVEIKSIKNLKGQEFLRMTSYNEVRLPHSSIIKGEIKNPPIVVEAIKKCCKKINGRPLATNVVIAALPDSQCYYKVISLPPQITPQNIHKFISAIINKNFPLEKDELYYDWQYISQNTIAIAAAPQNIVDSYTDSIEKAGLVPLVLELETIAITRALQTKIKPNTKNYHVFMDLGAGSSSIVATYNNNPVLTLNIPLSGNKMTEEIARMQNINIEKAEKLKISCGFDMQKCPVKTRKIINNLIDDSANQIKRGLDYTNRFLKHKIDKIYIGGGVSRMSKITDVLSKKLGVKVQHANPLTNIVLDKKIKLSNSQLLKYVTAIGLAMKGAEDNVIKLK